VSGNASTWNPRRLGRKGIVCIASLAMAAAFAFFVASPSWNLVLIIGVLFGLGYGAYISVDWALAPRCYHEFIFRLSL
jgi:MFS family permease